MLIGRLTKLVTAYGRSVARANSRVEVRACLRTYAPCLSADKFKDAVANSTKLKEEPDNSDKLELYALYKQATVGPCNAPKPGMFDLVGKAKFEAWVKLGSIDKDEAMKQYIAKVDSLAKQYGLTGGSGKAESNEKPAESAAGELTVTRKDAVLTIRLNRPNRKNAVTVAMMNGLRDAFASAAKDDSITMVVMTGAGDFYSSGNDLGNFAKLAPGADLAAMADQGRKLLIEFVDLFIDFPKPLIAAVNGPALGIMCTTLALFDVVVCSDKAYFHTPFATTAQSPEGCSSVLFPQIMGCSKATEMLMFDYKMSADEAAKCGFVSKVVPSNEFDKYIDQWIHGSNGILKGSRLSMVTAKSLTRSEAAKEHLRQVNRRECQALAGMWLSPDFAQALAKFFARKN